MMKIYKKKAFAQTKTAALITAALIAATAMLLTACSGRTKASADTNSASLILSPDKLTITVTAITADGSAVAVEGCTETILASGTETILHAQSTTVILKGKIGALFCHENQLTELDVQGCTALQWLCCPENQLTVLNVQGCSALELLLCGKNQLTELNVQECIALRKLSCSNNRLMALNIQGCTALQGVYCYRNQLNAQALTRLLTGLPVRPPRDDAECILYIEDSEEGNYTDFAEFTAPAELYSAVQNAKTKNWKLYKWDSGRNDVEL